MGTSMVSIIENNPDMAFVFHIFTDGFSKQSENYIHEFAQKFHCDCTIYVLNMDSFNDFHIKVARFSRITYGRLYMPKVLKHIASRFIYVDADAMCVNSLHDLWFLDMDGKAMGAVSETADAVKYRAGYLQLKSGKYFNDGIMLVDVEQWEKQHITEKCFSYQSEPSKRFLGQSQDVLNLVFDGNNYFLPSRYNVYGGGYKAPSDSVFIHWTGRRKPWQMVLTDFDAQWRKYNALSPWPTITNILPIKKPENYHDFQQWGRYQKAHGNMAGYFKGIFWYSWLRIRYKLHI
jgi:lipopolysaccharide biosynthesis glycosyltransferase